MKRILLAIALAIPAIAACSASSAPESDQTDGLKEWRQKVPAAEAKALVDDLQSHPKESACYPRKCDVSAPDADGNVTVVFLASVCCNCGGYQECAAGWEWDQALGQCMPY